MSFRPQTGAHSIVETAISINVMQPIGGDLIEKLAKAHDSFKPDLPRMQRKAGFAFMVGAGDAAMAPTLPPMGGIIFDRVNPDGSLHSRINVDPNMITVNILNYTRWAEVWEKARDYLRRVGDILLVDSNRVSGATLQYVDLFDWDGDPTEYDAYKLISAEQGIVPKSLPRNSLNWHSHQGWFVPAHWSPADRVLERIHFDSIAADDGVTRVKVDTFLRYDILHPRTASDMVTGAAPAMDAVFDHLHTRCNQLFRSAITDDVARGIGLDA